MKNFNKLAVYSSALAFTIGVSACGETASTPTASTTSTETPTVKPKPKSLKNNKLPISSEYYSDGTRDLNIGSGDNRFDDIIEFCDGRDLVEISGITGSNGDAGASISRSVGHHACLDRKLTPSDFK